MKFRSKNLASQLWERLPAATIEAGSPSHRHFIEIPKQYLDAEDGRIIGSYPSGNHPVSRGALCVKGWNSYEFVNKLDRLTSPLIKRNGRFEESGWEEALGLVSRRFR